MMLLTLPFMAISGGGRSPAPPPPVPAPKRRRLPWRPRVTLVGLICGIVAGAGVVVLLQQYSIAYPTRNEFITVLVAGAVVYGLLLPTLAGTVRWMRANRRLAAIRRSA
jgi:high-affinity Fe2+/Pb2+ permease